MRGDTEFWTRILRSGFVGVQRMRPGAVSRLRAWTETWKAQHAADVVRIHRDAAVIRAAKKAVDPDYPNIHEETAKIVLAAMKVDLPYKRHTMPGGSYLTDEWASTLRGMINDRQLDIDPYYSRMARWRERLAYWCRKPKPKTPTLTTLASFCAEFGADLDSTKWLVSADAAAVSSAVQARPVSVTRPAPAEHVDEQVAPVVDANKPYSFFGGLS